MGVWQVYGGRGFTALGDLVPHKHTVLTVSSGDKEFFLRDDDVIFPGLADFHVHLRGNQNTLGVPPAVLTSSGVFLVADAGTHGWMHWAPPPTSDPIPFRKYWVALLPHGLDSYPESPKFCGLTGTEDVQLRDLFHSNPQIMGLKIRLGQHDAGEDRALLREGIKQARANQVGLMIHLTGTYLSWQEILEPLIAGDVLTHVFHGRRGSLLKDPHAASLLGKAQDRGVILDVGHGANHFAWEAFGRALAEGIAPTTISTDLTQHTWQQPPVYDLPFVCSKLLAAGLNWRAVYQGVVLNPTRHLRTRLPDRSIVVMRFVASPTAFEDAQGVILQGEGLWQPVMVVAAGHPVTDRLTPEPKAR